MTAKNTSKRNVIQLTDDQLEILSMGEEDCGMTFVRSPDWSGGDKWQTRSVIFKIDGDDRYYEWETARTGSHYSEWTYQSDTEATEVFRVAKMVEVVTFE